MKVTVSRDFRVRQAVRGGGPGDNPPPSPITETAQTRTHLQGSILSAQAQDSTAQLYLGDYREVLDHVRANLIFTSPPYNIGSKAERSDGDRKHGRFDRKSYGAIRDYDDTLPESEYQNQQAEFLVWAADHLTPNGILVYNHKPRRRNKQLIHPASWFLRPEVEARLVLVEEVVWDRGSTHNHDKTMMWPHTERLYVFRRPDGDYKLRNDEGLSDVWRIPLTSQSNGHAAPFPLALAGAVIRLWSDPGDLVCDPYAGSGTTAIAATEHNRRFVGAEILPKYYELASQRIANTPKQVTIFDLAAVPA